MEQQVAADAQRGRTRRATLTGLEVDPLRARREQPAQEGLPVERAVALRRKLRHLHVNGPLLTLQARDALTVARDVLRVILVRGIA